MKRYRNIVLGMILAIGLIIVSDQLNAQPPTGGGPGGGPPCFPPPCVPIDGGVTFLLIAGAAYGGKKAYDLKHKA